MKTNHFILILFMLFSYLGKSQEVVNSKDSILIAKGTFGENIFVVGDSVVTKRYFNDVIKTNYEAHEFFRKGNNLNILSTVLGIAGGGAIGFTLGGLISGGDPNWAVGGAGVVILMINYPIKSSSKYNLKKATDTYNRGLNNDASFWNKSEMNLFITGNGIGFNFKF